MNIFRQLRWQLTLSYTIVTVSALLVIFLVLAGMVFSGIFLPERDLKPELMIEDWMNDPKDSSYPILSRILSQSPVDIDLLNVYHNSLYSAITDVTLARIGALQFRATTYATIRSLIIGLDGTLLATNDLDQPVYLTSIGMNIGGPFDPTQIPGLDMPLKAALAGDRDPRHLYTTLVPGQKYVMAAPIFNSNDQKKNQVVGALVVFFNAIPTQEDIPAHMLRIAGMSLIILFLSTAIMGAVFGYFFAHGLATRFKHISATTDQWSAGDFTRYIDDTTGDEITQFAQRMNHMAQQLESLLKRRQAIAVSEERNRLARDLHDSAKQQSLAASFELGTALTLYERNPQDAKKHVIVADQLVDSVRKELTALVDELRPQPVDGQDFSELLSDYAEEWSRHSGIELIINIVGTGELSVEIRETLFRIVQEALANIARHSSAIQADLTLAYGTGMVALTIQDNGCGFDPHAKHPGIGLSSMRERAEGWGGSFTVESQPGQGTQIKMSIPIAYEAEAKEVA